ncbi:MAG: flippase [Prevotella sp.]|nr:flippase [Prevotella sp.]
MSLKQNFIYSSILTVSTYLFPLLVYPYVSRILGVSNIGIVNFIDNLINYFVLISMMGITTVGVREIAAARSDKEKLSRTFMSLFALTAITTLIAIAALWIAMYAVPTLFPFRDMLYIGVAKLLFNLFLLEWFFMGMEEFKYITKRSIIVKCGYVLCVFLLVKDSSDYKIYYFLIVAMLAVNAVINVIYSRKYVHFSLQFITIRPFVKTFLLMGVYVLLANVYQSLNPVWLGFVTNTDEVGYFTTATKLHTIIMAVLISFTNILFPRVSNLLSEGKKEEFWKKINISFDAILLFTFPTIIFVLVAGPALLNLIVGDGFEGSYLPLRIITPLVLIIGIEQIVVIQILMAMHQDNTVLRNSFIGASVALFFNIILTADLGAVGSAIVWVIAEVTILSITMIDIYKKYNYTLPYKRLAVYCISYTPLLIISIIVYNNMNNGFAALSSVAILTVAYSVLNETLILKNQVTQQLLKSLHL